MRKIVVFWVVLLLTATYAIAQDEIVVESRAIRDAISAGDTALFNITVSNNGRFDDSFRLSFSNDVEWTVLTDPLRYKLGAFNLNVGESVSFLVKIRAAPSAALNYNQYAIAMEVRGKGSKMIATEIFTLGYGPQFLTPKQYAALVIATLDVPEKIDPRAGIPIKIFLRNRNPLNISDLEIEANSALVSQKTFTHLEPLEEKTIVFHQELDPLQSPVRDILVVTVVRQNVTLVRLEKTFDVVSYSQFEESVVKQKGFLSTTSIISVRNNGNFIKEETVKYEVSFMQRLFTQTSQKAFWLKEDGHRYLAWHTELGPDETTEIKVVVSYLPLLFLCVLGVLVTFAYYLLRSPIVLIKNAVIVARKEGGISGLKVMLRVANRSGRKIWGVSVVDSIPKLIDVEKGFEVGIVKPTRILRHSKKGTLVKWNLGELEAGEERILSYKVQARFTIVGSFVLPAPVVKFVQGGQDRVAYANRLKVNF
ncbi:MAG: hypothetical protein ABIG95_07070 [Candidatus Woesearchaeota archaeon]